MLRKRYRPAIFVGLAMLAIGPAFLTGQSISASEIQTAMQGVWELDSRTLADGTVLTPPNITGILVATREWSFAIIPMLDKPDVNMIFLARNEYKASGQTSELQYLTFSANAPNNMVGRQFQPESGQFTRRVTAKTQERIEAAGRINKSLAARVGGNVIVHQLPNTPTHIYRGNLLTVVDEGFVDTYSRKAEDASLTSENQEAMQGVWQLQSRTLSSGEEIDPSTITGTIIATRNYSVGIVPLVGAPDVNMVFVARNFYSAAGQTSTLQYLTFSANHPKASQVMTSMAPETGTFTDSLQADEVQTLAKVRGDSAERLKMRSDTPTVVQRLPNTPLHVYQGDELHVIDPSFVDVYARVEKP